MAYIPGLDGLRGLAIVLVMLFHAQVPGLPGGNLGVDLFFVLSGFLITSLLLNELRLHGVIDLRRFFWRRWLRLTPPLLLCLLLYALAAAWVWPDYPFHLRDGLWAVFYVSNFATVAGYSPEKLLHTWSLALEEQFYLLWPAMLGVLWPLQRRLPLWLLLVVVYVALVIWRAVVVGVLEVSTNEAYYRPDLRCSGLVLGAALAAWLQRRPAWPVLAEGAWPLLVILILLAVLLWPRGSAAHLIVAVSLAELCTAGLILLLTCSHGGWVSRALTLPPLVFLGQISYGLYLYHYPIMVTLRGSHGWLITLAAGCVASLVLALLSFHTLEAVVRRFRLNRFKPEGAHRVPQ